MLRHPNLDLALFIHNRENIHDYGMYHQGADLVILNKANYAEDILKRDLQPGGIVVDFYDKTTEIMSEPVEGEEAQPIETETKTYLRVTQEDNELSKVELAEDADINQMVLQALEPHLEALINKYQ